MDEISTNAKTLIKVMSNLVEMDMVWPYNGLILALVKYLNRAKLKIDDK